MGRKKVQESRASCTRVGVVSNFTSPWTLWWKCQYSWAFDGRLGLDLIVASEPIVINFWEESHIFTIYCLSCPILERILLTLHLWQSPISSKERKGFMYSTRRRECLSRPKKQLACCAKYVTLLSSFIFSCLNILYTFLFKSSTLPHPLIRVLVPLDLYAGNKRGKKKNKANLGMVCTMWATLRVN
jgi:hypothetical protein